MSVRSVQKNEKMAMKFMLGRKGRMTQIFTEEGECVPVTILEVGPCWVTGVRSAERDGYDAVQIGFDQVREKVLSKPELGHLKAKELPPLRVLKECRLDSPADLEVGAQLGVDVFQVGERVDVTGVSKGRGFAGAMKRYNFGGGPMTHGGMCRRFPGAIGQHTYPGRVFKGKRMPGHFGTDRIKVKNLEVMHIDTERNLLLVRGAVPGHRGALVEVSYAKCAKASQQA